jgi:hypothetical protein
MRYVQIAANHRAALACSERVRRAAWLRLLAYSAAILPLLLILGLAWIYPDSNRREVPDWRQVVALADVAREKSELYDARHLYLRAGQIASRAEDWEGILTAACGIKELGGDSSVFSVRNMILLAMMVAERRQSRLGISAAAGAFTGIGAHEAAAMGLRRIRTDWPDETKYSGASYSDCWGPVPAPANWD